MNKNDKYVFEFQQLIYDVANKNSRHYLQKKIHWNIIYFWACCSTQLQLQS